MIKVKARPTAADLPKDYQFGHARDPLFARYLSRAEFGLSPWRPLHDNAAERLKRYQTEYDGT